MPPIIRSSPTIILLPLAPSSISSCSELDIAPEYIFANSYTFRRDLKHQGGLVRLGLSWVNLVLGATSRGRGLAPCAAISVGSIFEIPLKYIFQIKEEIMSQPFSCGCTCIPAGLNDMTLSSTNTRVEAFGAHLAISESMPACLFPPFTTLAPRQQISENEVGLLSGIQLHFCIVFKAKCVTCF